MSRNTTVLILAAALAAQAAQAAPVKTAVFAGGCFWSIEKAFEATPGVVSAVSGYAGGTQANPSYEDHEGYVEAVRVTYDPDKVSYGQLVSKLFHSIDPTDAGGQICDRGPSYQSAIFVGDDAERRGAEAGKAAVARQIGAPVATEIRDAGRFWPAEAYHQDFAKKNPARYELYRVGCGRDGRIKAVWGHLSADRAAGG